MKVDDFSSPLTPSLAAQRDALQKGLGRAMQWARSGRLAEEPLLDACLHDKRYERQFEDNRGGWLWGLLQQAGTAERIREAILQAFRIVDNEGDADQLSELALHYARAGYRDFETALYDYVAHKPHVDWPWVGDTQLLELAGVAGFRFIIQARGRRLANHAWGWDDAAMVDQALEKWGEGRVRAVLKEPDDPASRRFRAAWEETQNESARSKSGRDAENRPLTVAEVLAAGQADSGQRTHRLSTWGLRAREDDLRSILDAIWSESSASTISRLLHVFRYRPLPGFDARWIDLIRHPDQEVRRWALTALEHTSHPQIREFALGELEPESQAVFTTGRSIVGLFVKNFQPGDERRLLDRVELPADPFERHGMLIDVRNLLQENANADPSTLGLIVYAETPCDMCRAGIVPLLKARNAAPTWLLEECRDDANEEIRKEAQGQKS